MPIHKNLTATKNRMRRLASRMRAKGNTEKQIKEIVRRRRNNGNANNN